jgi:hypothetical protein
MLPHHKGDFFNHDKIIRILGELDKKLELTGIQRKVRLYAIGGTIMVLERFRQTSKDIDFIVSRKDFMMLSQCIPQIERDEKVQIDVFPDGDMPDYQYRDYHIHACKTPWRFKNVELYYVDKADFMLTKILAARDLDASDIAKFIPSPETVPLDVLRSRYERIVPDKGKIEMIKGRFETFVDKFYKNT